jgi:hypothetical protein
MIMTRQLIVTLCALLWLTTPGLAHTVWIEPLEGKLVVRFAEPGNKFEKSPGHLDSLTAPVSFILGPTNAPVAIETPKKSDHFLLVGAPPTNIVCTETIFTVRGGRKPYFYARWQPVGASAGTPLLTLDLVPTGQPGEVRAYFRGQPLGGIKGILYTPDEKKLEIVADAHGFLRFKTEQSGQYLLALAHHREPLAGFHVGRPYHQTSHNAALSWRQP